VRVDRGVDFIAEAKIQTLFSVCNSYDVTSHKASKRPESRVLQPLPAAVFR
jgi:hypothetical protein